MKFTYNIKINSNGIMSVTAKPYIKEFNSLVTQLQRQVYAGFRFVSGRFTLTYNYYPVDLLTTSIATKSFGGGVYGLELRVYIAPDANATLINADRVSVLGSSTAWRTVANVKARIVSF